MITKFSTYRQTWFTAWRWLLALLIVLGTNVTALTPAAYAFPAEPVCVVGWGFGEGGLVPAGLSDVVAISAGGSRNTGSGQSLALKSDGTVVGWGSNGFGQATLPAGLNDVVSISAGAFHSLALKADGTVVGWGDDSYGQATPPDGLSDVVAIAAGEYQSLALKVDGTVVGWGGNELGEATPPDGLSNVVAIDAGRYFSLALKADGTVVAWGEGLGAELPAGLSDVVAISAEYNHGLALKADGTVVAWGTDLDGESTPPAGLSDVVAIAAGGAYSLALKSDSTVVWWGDQYPASPPFALSNVTAIAAGYEHNLALTTNCPSGNTAPAASDDSYTTDEDTPLSVPAPGVLANDSDTEGDPLTAQPMTAPANGTLLLNADGSFTYTPDANFYGSDSFTYVANDGMADSNEATVTITVNPVNDAPVAVDDNYSTNEDVPLIRQVSDLLSNDTDVDGDQLTWDGVVSRPAHGQVFVASFNGIVSFGYSPDPNFNGTDSFTYQVTDGTALSNEATVTITVNPVNDAPVAVDDNYSTDEDVPLIRQVSDLLSNDTDVDGDQLTWDGVVSRPAHGQVFVASFNGIVSFGYSPDPNFNGTDSFTYQVTDGISLSNMATVTITVNPVNDAPVAVDDSYLTDEDVSLIVPAPGVQDNDTDVDGDTLTSLPVSGPAHGSLSLNADGSFTYTPDANFNGNDSFTYKLNDGTTDSNVANVSITIGGVNDAPVAANDNYATDEDTPLNIPAPGVIGNDSDADGDPLSAALVDAPAYGTLTFNSDGSFSYMPDANFNGSDSFTYQLDDGQANSNIATVNITVNTVNDAPLAADDAYATNEDMPLTIAAPGVVGNDTDADGNSLTAVLVSGPAHGTLALNSDGSFSYTPAANFNGSDSFTYKVNDGQVDSNVATVTLTIVAVNDTPIAGNDSYSTNEDLALNVAAPGVLGNDSDPVEGSPLTAALVSGPAHGTLTLNANGSFTYTPAHNYSGSDSFTYKANDGGADSNIATVSITVVSASDMINTLIANVQALVNNGTLNSGDGNALIVKLDNAEKKLMSGQTGTAINLMQAFINQVNAFSGNQLSAAQAQALINDANAIIAALN